MFDQTFVDSVQKLKEPFALAISVLVETCAVALLVFMPLIYTQALPSAHLKSLLTMPSSPDAAPKPRVETQAPKLSSARRSSVFVAPSFIPKQINTKVDELRAPPDLTISGSNSSVPGAIDSLNPGVIGSVPETPAPGLPPFSKMPSGPVRVGVGVAEANLTHKVLPIYPALAKSARVQGTVEFTAIISKQGMIENLRLVRGHPLLVPAAREAVVQWRYRPTLLNGQPIEVVTDIMVNFTLSQ